MTQVFGSWFWGFDPERHPFAGFSHEGSRSTLLRRAKHGDVIAIVGTQTDPTPKGEKGRLLGLIEFIHDAVQAEDLIADGEDLPEHLIKDGQFRWPYAVPAARAWKFKAPPMVRDVIGRQLKPAAMTGTDPFTEEEAAAVLALERYEVELPENAYSRRHARTTSGRSRSSATAVGHPGPPPCEWSALTSHVDAPTYTYLLRFGTSNAWKVGISGNPPERAKSLNFGVPSEVLGGQCWNLELVERWDTGGEAYAMEQALLRQLMAYSQGQERLLCPRQAIDREWQDYLRGRLV